MLSLVLGLVLTLTLHPAPVVLAILWMIVGLLLVSVIVLTAPPLRRQLARLGGDDRPADESAYGVHIGSPQGPVNIYTQPAGAPAAPSSGPATRRDFHRETVRLTDLIEQGRRPVLQGYGFDDCDIYGPAVIALVRGGEIRNCQFTASEDAVFIEITIPRDLVGIIGLYNTRFQYCRFHEVGIAAPAEFIERFKAS